MLAGGLLLVGWAMLRFGGASVERPPEDHAHPVAQTTTAVTGFAMKLSTPAESVELKDRAGRVLFRAGAADPLTGMLSLDAADPVVFVSLRWKAPMAEGLNHFAKLTLEPAGKPTLVHYFEAPGDLDDVWELPTE